MSQMIEEMTKIAQAETYAISYVQLHEDVSKLTVLQFAQKVIDACDELVKAFGDKYTTPEGATILVDEGNLLNLRIDAYAKAYAQAHYDLHKITPLQFAQYVEAAGDELWEKFGKEGNA